jgi:hypothetical protein
MGTMKSWQPEEILTTCTCPNHSVIKSLRVMKSFERGVFLKIWAPCSALSLHTIGPLLEECPAP